MKKLFLFFCVAFCFAALGCDFYPLEWPQVLDYKVSANVDAVYGRVTLTWKSFQDAEKYEIYRSGYKIGESDTNSYTDVLVLSSGNSIFLNYEYYVRAYASKQKNEAPYSTYISVPVEIPSVQELYDLELKNEAFYSARLQWLAIPDANSYSITRDDIPLTTVSGTSYLDKNLTRNKTYTYKIQAHSNSKGDVRYITDYITVNIGTTIGLYAYALSQSTVNISCDAVDGADSYKIYRSSYYNFGYDQIGTSSSASYIDSAVSAGQQYYYVMTAYSSSDLIESTSSYVSIVTPPSGTIPLDSGAWTSSEIILGGTRYFYFVPPGAGTYYVQWNDKDDGNHSQTCDVRVSIWYNNMSNGVRIVSDADNGWTNPVQFGYERGGILVQVTGYAGSTGTFAIRYYK